MLSTSRNPIRSSVFSHEDDTITNPGAGIPADYACPANARIRITSFTCTVTNIGANKKPLGQIIDAAAHVLTLAASTHSLQNLSTEHVWASINIPNDVHLLADNELRFGLPPDIILQPGETFRITLPAIGAAQSITNIALSFDQWVIA